MQIMKLKFLINTSPAIKKTQNEETLIITHTRLQTQRLKVIIAVTAVSGMRPLPFMSEH